MPDNGQPPDNNLDRRLEDLGDHVEYPPTPDLAATVRESLGEQGRQRPALAGWVAAAVVVLISLPILAGIVFSGGLGGGGGAVGSSGSEDSGGGEAATEQADAPAEATSGPSGEEMMVEKESEQGLAESAGGTLSSSAASSASLGEPFDFGKGIPPKKARKRSDPPLLLPTFPGYERPDEIYVGRQPNHDGLVLVYGIRETSPRLGDSEIGAVLTELDGGVQQYIADTNATSIEEVTVGDSPGYWSPDGAGTTSPLGTAEKLPGNVLVWEIDGQALRFQADIPRDEAIRIAESVR